MADQVVVHGMRELAEVMLRFPEQVQRKALVKVMRAGGMVVVQRARVTVSKVSGKLARSIRVTIVRRGGWLTARVIAGRNVKKEDPFYAWMVEGGTKPHEIRAKGGKSLFIGGLFRTNVQHPGAKPKRYLGPALEDQVQAIVDAMQEEFSAQLAELGWGT